MIEGSGLNNVLKNTLNQANNKETKVSSKDESKRAAADDSVEVSTNRAEENARPQANPIADRDEAGAVTERSAEIIETSPGSAVAAQANLDPEKVLSLIA